jgi:hypothetical protein
VSSALSSSVIGSGLALGLFAVLSIIRLRSTELDQNEVAYYFSALGLGILGGIDGVPPVPTIGLMTLILTVIFIGDHPRLLQGYQRQIVVLDIAVTDQVALVARLEQLLGARVHGATVQRVDLVNDTTTVEVRYGRRHPQRESGPDGTDSGAHSKDRANSRDGAVAGQARSRARGWAPHQSREPRLGRELRLGRAGRS